MPNTPESIAGSSDPSRLDADLEILSVWLELAGRVRNHQLIAIQVAAANVATACRQIKDSTSREEWCEKRTSLGLAQFEKNVTYWNSVYDVVGKNCIEAARHVRDEGLRSMNGPLRRNEYAAVADPGMHDQSRGETVYSVYDSSLAPYCETNAKTAKSSRKSQ